MATEKDAKAPAKSEKRKNAWKSLPDVIALIKPRRGLLALGFVLMAINRVSGLVLPVSTKYLIDNVIGKRQIQLLTPLVLAVLAATVVQGLTSFTLTQLLSKSAQKMITDLRRQVQAHIGRLPVSFYDANKTGVLVSRIMSDVEGVRNLIGTGLVEFAGGLMTAVIALGYLLYTSVTMTAVAFSILLVFGFAINKAFATIRPIFRARPKINAEVTGRLTESLGGVRVVKGYHAEEREEGVFAAGVQRLLDNVLKTLTATSLMSLSASGLMGIVSAIIMALGAHKIIAGTMTLGTFFSFIFFLGLLIAPVFQIVAIGTQITEAITGLERTREILNEKLEDETPGRTVDARARKRPSGDGKCEFCVRHAEGSAARRQLSVGAGDGHGAGGAVRRGKVDDHRVDCGVLRAVERARACGRRGPFDGEAKLLPHAAWRRVAGNFSVRWNDSRKCGLRAAIATEEEILAACHIARVDEFAESFEQKYDTVVGERGVKLSGGQKQRVSIARAILADPRILILDEATSSLDSESEALIQEGLRYLMRGRTTFVIAHRLSTIRRAEQILVVEGGRVIERGTHATLYALGGRYYDLYTKQHAVEANLFLAPGEGDAEDGGASEGSAGGNGRTGTGLPDAIRIIRGQSG